jgi:TPR repeat protein
MDPAEAARWYRKAAEQGLAEAQFNLGLRYYKGEGVRKSRTMALKWFRKAAAQGHPTAKDAVKELSR